MKISMPVLVCWLFAAWWLVIGIREYNLIMYRTAGSSRYRKTLPLIICLLTSLDLGLLGYAILISNRPFTILFLILFTILWLSWSFVVKKLGKTISY